MADVDVANTEVRAFADWLREHNSRPGSAVAVHRRDGRARADQVRWTADGRPARPGLWDRRWVDTEPGWR